MFQRIELLIGNENLLKIKEKTVLIVGLGGVGGYALESLVRSGIENFILIDYDKIDITNLNRQLITNQNNIGNSKVQEYKKRILEINPNSKVELLEMFLDENNINVLNNYKIDYIVDCCDSVNTKKSLIDYSLEKNIKIISSMGTAKKLDPSKLQITDIRKTSYDPLAKIIRKYIKDKKINKKIMVVSSIEEPSKIKELGTMIFVPASAGILIGNYIIKDIIK